ncbi:MAG TPA: serine hydrolase, partial [Acidimicrobiales bacterium]|nr:serine hydrolase [Acidimicrobiales bacterium]
MPPGVDLGPLLDAAFTEPERLGQTYAVVVVHRGRLVAERYGGALPHFDRPPEPVTAQTPLLSWSIAKSMLHAAVGLLVGDGLLATGGRADVEWWQGPGDPRRAVTVEHLLAMRDGLDFVEDYVDDTRSDVIEMLFGSGRHDVARFAADRPLAAEPGRRFNYSSGTSNIVAAVMARLVGRGEDSRRFLVERLFGPVAMGSAAPTFDEAGTWVASSYVHATARDFARFGLLYLRDGVVDGRRLLPAGWVDHGRRPRSVDADGSIFGAH